MGTRILITDDDPVVRHILGSVIKSQKYEVLLATSGKECLALIQSSIADGSPPDLIFLDLQLLDMTGAEVVSEIRKLSSTTRIPIVMLSANSEEETRKMFPQLDADMYLEKPFPPTTVIEIVNKFLNN